ncbi:hypothetical protein Q765_14085 [Flavobacterium rivuli WB 3.3-2 = DSM 21788]|uniref:Secretion system C-terminal sorting domain-containing protein n=1 Tax=Flavobacterium rivuli WB 3.3-2 = DSM 21788 TaxID=1121895 RepID=A0A0A2M0H8_9FLAO|nr:T9SS type A sorting domain-containing protein [Flavobacterium rivuli]KGO85754.1 hypothetical protein Q765_14085 [Flavobacterium rivuli WB 3.3-2 = DSM 21788]
MKTQLRSLLAGCILACSPAIAQTTSSTADANSVLACTAPVAEEIQTLCTGAKVGDIVAGTNPGAVVQWYFVGFITQPVAITDNAIDGGRYTVTQTIDGCTSPPTNVFVNLVDAPTEPTGAAAQDFTTGETVANLEVTAAEGNAVKWYTRNEALEYTLVARDAALTDGTTYYATQSNGNCESTYHAVTVSEILATDNEVLRTVSVFPNPATSVITINGKNVITQIVVTNLLGQKVLTQANNAATAQVNIAALSAGTYAVQLQTAQGTATVKVIKQ